MRATTYRIDGENEGFKTLRAAKYHIYGAYTPNERIKYFGKEPCYILGIGNHDEIVSLTEIKVDKNGRESFGKTYRYRY